MLQQGATLAQRHVTFMLDIAQSPARERAASVSLSVTGPIFMCAHTCWHARKCDVPRFIVGVRALQMIYSLQLAQLEWILLTA